MTRAQNQSRSIYSTPLSFVSLREKVASTRVLLLDFIIGIASKAKFLIGTLEPIYLLSVADAAGAVCLLYERS